MKLASLITLLLCAAGCTTTGKNGVQHRVILGFGVVTLPPDDGVATVTKVKAFGVYVSDAPGTKFTAGYVNQTSTLIKTNANVLIEVK